MNDAQVRAELRRALAGCAPAAYHSNPEFHAAVHLLAEMLPDMVLGLAVEASRRREAGAQAVIRAQDWPAIRPISRAEAVKLGLLPGDPSTWHRPEEEPDDPEWQGLR